MKKLVFLIISLQFALGALWAQKTLSDEQKEKIATYVRSQTEDNCRKLLNSNGYIAYSFINGYPQCLDGYVFYTHTLKIAGEEEPITFPSQKGFYIENGKIIDLMNSGLTCEVAFTLTAKNHLDNDCLVFIGTNGWAYEFNFFKFDKVVPLSLEIKGISFMDNTLKNSFSFIVTDNNDKENNRSYDFSKFANDLNCKGIEFRNSSISNQAKDNISPSTALKQAYDYVGPTANMFGLRMIILNGKWGYIDNTGKEIVPPKYEDQWDFSEDGLSKVKLGGKWGYVDKAGQEVISPKYEDSRSFFEGLACVKQNGKWGFIDKTGQEVIPLQYDEASNFSEGFAKVTLNGRSFNIDKTGKETTH